MINIEYTEGIKITTGNLKGLFKEEQLPLRFQIKKVISKTIIWEVLLGDNMWATYPESEINDVIVKDAKGNFIYQHYWDVLKHGTIFYKSLWLYCKGLINEGKRPKGLVIGTHDGEFGEWVPLVRNFMSDMVLVEGSEDQFNRLRSNFQGKEGLEFVNNIITPDGGEVEFFEGGKGYTNSVVERVIRGWEKEEIYSTKKSSIAINDLLSNYNFKFDWFHFDVEGLDAKLLFKVKEDLLPYFIIFEDFNLIPEEKENIFKYLTDKSYQIHSEAGISVAIKK